MTKHRAIPPHQPASPCVNICVMDPTSGVCTGCLRTLDEIAAWGSLSPDQRSAIMEELPTRRLGIGPGEARPARTPGG
ncbi:DUF1289 domain-containing protein [Paracoccus sp. (in: a-proteobacteria)]|uniref:DUF1289 domain-containing protein n=1 Tax=Paracoccus sp. TaxID=267 RepID=UPI003A849C4A